MKNNILHIINSMEPGGAENLLKFQLPHFNHNKYNIHIGFLIGSGSLFKKNWPKNNNIKIIDFSSDGKFYYKSIFRINDYIKKNNIDIVHSHLMQSGIISKLISIFNKKVKSISTRHYGRASKGHRLVNKIEDILVNYDCKIICVSKHIEHYMKEIGMSEEKLKVIYNGIRVDYYKNLNKVKNDNFTIGTVGRINDKKGIDTVLKAFKKILKDYPNVKLNIIGDGPSIDKYIKLSFNLGINQSVNFMGYMQPHKVMLEMSKWNLFILASKAEGFGMVLIEAGALGIPVIATRVDAIPEIIKNDYNGFLVDVDNVDQIYIKSLHLIRSPHKREILSKNGLNNVYKNFSILKMVKETEKIYEEILQL